MDKPICTLPGAESLTPHEQNKRLQAACRRLFSTEDGKIVLNMLLTDLKFFDGAVSEKDSVLNEYAKFFLWMCPRDQRIFLPARLIFTRPAPRPHLS